MQANFLKDQTGMNMQLSQLNLLIKFMDPQLYYHLVQANSDNLFCCFRSLLIRFKREFLIHDIMDIWERFWSNDHVHFHLFFALALLNAQRFQLLKLNAFDEILKFINTSAMNHNVLESLARAHVLLELFECRIASVSKSRLMIELPVTVDVDQQHQDTICKDEEIIELIKLLELKYYK